MRYWLPVGVMNTVTNARSLYYTANVDETMKKGPCVAMMPYGVIGLERVWLIALQMHCMFCNNNNNLPAHITVREVTEQKLNILLEWPYIGYL